MRGALRRAIGNLHRVHYGRPHTEILTVPAVFRDVGGDEFDDRCAEAIPGVEQVLSPHGGLSRACARYGQASRSRATNGGDTQGHG